MPPMLAVVTQVCTACTGSPDAQCSVVFIFLFLFNWHVQNAMVPCKELLPFLSVIYFFVPPSPPTILPNYLTSSCHLFLGLPLNLLVSNSFIIHYTVFIH